MSTCGAAGMDRGSEMCLEMKKQGPGSNGMDGGSQMCLEIEKARPWLKHQNQFWLLLSMSSVIA